MKKELIFAIIGGSILGILIGFGIYRVNSIVTKNNKAKIVDNKKLSSPKNFTIALSKLNDNDVILTNPLELSGLTKGGTNLIISTEDKDYLVNVPKEGIFSKEIELTGGINQINLWAVDANGQDTTLSTTLIYSTEFAKLILDTTNKEEVASDSVRQKIQEVTKNPKAYVGVVTDISSTTIQLKNAQGAIEQIAYDADVVVVKDGKSPKIQKSTDIAIGDYLLAMGLVNGNKVLTAKRIIITSPPTKQDLKFNLVNVENNTKSIVTGIDQKTKEGIKIFLDANTDILEGGKQTKFSSVKANSKIISIGTVNTDGVKARTIYIIQ